MEILIVSSNYDKYQNHKKTAPKDAVVAVA
jgi:hypothetical protein